MTTTAPSAAQTSNSYGTGIEGTSSNVNTDGGAAGGQSGSFNLSKGGLAAIIVVVAIVAIIGITSTILFVVAKRRQWTLRESMQRASRKFTPRRGDTPRQAAFDRRSKRAGVQLDATPAQKGHKRGLMVEVRDVEKGYGRVGDGVQKPQRAVDSSWSTRVWRKDGKP